MRPLCIADASALIHLSDLSLARRPLHRWLWDEFDVKFSQVIWDEVLHRLNVIGRRPAAFKRDGENYILPLPTMDAFERALFSREYKRRVHVGRCRRCGWPLEAEHPFMPDLDAPDDRGERHNLCIALDAVVRGPKIQALYLTDDFWAIRDYAEPTMDIFPIGSIWTSYDFIVFLFVRHRRRIVLQDAKDAIKDLTAVAAGSGAGNHTQKAQERWTTRFVTYQRKITNIDSILARLA